MFVEYFCHEKEMGNAQSHYENYRLWSSWFSVRLGLIVPFEVIQIVHDYYIPFSKRWTVTMNMYETDWIIFNMLELPNELPAPDLTSRFLFDENIRNCKRLLLEPVHGLTLDVVGLIFEFVPNYYEHIVYPKLTFNFGRNIMYVVHNQNPNTYSFGLIARKKFISMLGEDYNRYNKALKTYIRWMVQEINLGKIKLVVVDQSFLFWCESPSYVGV